MNTNASSYYGLSIYVFYNMIGQASLPRNFEIKCLIYVTTYHLLYFLTSFQILYSKTESIPRHL